MAKPSHASRDLNLLNAFWTEAAERIVLPNGLTLIVKRDTSAALASVQVWVKTGSMQSPPGRRPALPGAHAFKGTDRAPAAKSARLCKPMGYINAYTTFDRTVYYIDLPSEHTGIAIDILADAVLHSTLPADEVAKEQDVILREIAMTKDDPDNRLWDALFSTAFREHPYRQPIIGHRDVFSAVTRDDLLGYYRARYVPNNLVVVVVGHIDPAAIRAAVEQHFGAAPRVRLAPVLVPEEPGQLAPRTDHRGEEVELRVSMAWPIPGLSHDDAPVPTCSRPCWGTATVRSCGTKFANARLVYRLTPGVESGSTGLFCVSFTCTPAARGRGMAIKRTLAR